MAKVQVFTNSSSEMSPALAAEFGVIVIPDVVVFSPEEQYLNNVEIDPPAFFQKLQGRKKLPTTSHPNIAQYMDAFSTAGDCDEILFVGLTSKMSGSFSTACTAIRMLQEQGFATPITAYDSLQNCYALCMMALEAARMARAGASVAEITPRLDVLRGRIGAYFVVESMDNFRRAGKVGAIRVLAADLLNVKPILMFRDGHRAGRGHRATALRRRWTISWTATASRRSTARRSFSTTRTGRRWPHRSKSGCWPIDPDAKVRVEWIGAIIGAYTGAGCIGLAFHER